MEKVTFNSREFSISREKVSVLSCEYRITRDWDNGRVYALTCAAQSDEIDLDNIGDDITTIATENSMFSRNYVIMQSDVRLRNKLLEALSMEADDLENEADAKKYDKRLQKLYVGKSLTIGVITATISDLTNGKFTTWTPPIDGASATSQRVIPFVGDALQALVRASAQVLADCEESESEGDEE